MWNIKLGCPKLGSQALSLQFCISDAMFECACSGHYVWRSIHVAGSTVHTHWESTWSVEGDRRRLKMCDDSEEQAMSASELALKLNLSRLEELRASSRAPIQQRPGAQEGEGDRGSWAEATSCRWWSSQTLTHMLFSVLYPFIVRLKKEEEHNIHIFLTLATGIAVTQTWRLPRTYHQALMRPWRLGSCWAEVVWWSLRSPPGDPGVATDTHRNKILCFIKKLNNEIQHNINLEQETALSKSVAKPHFHSPDGAV